MNKKFRINKNFKMIMIRKIISNLMVQNIYIIIVVIRLNKYGQNSILEDKQINNLEINNLIHLKKQILKKRPKNLQ